MKSLPVALLLATLALAAVVPEAGASCGSVLQATTCFVGEATQRCYLVDPCVDQTVDASRSYWARLCIILIGPANCPAP